MLKYRDSKKMGKSNLGWLQSHFHFSFAEYYHPQNIDFGILRVINDDIIHPHSGFDTHPHRNMEIITYVADGELSHADSMEHRETLTRGQVQYMSAGSGVTHSEFNHADSVLRLLQIWVKPNQLNVTPNYGDYRFLMDERKSKWLHLVGSVDDKQSNAPINIYANVNFYATTMSENEKMKFDIRQGRQAYLVLIEGEVEINGIKLMKRDALEITEENIEILTHEFAHILLIEMELSK